MFFQEKFGHLKFSQENYLSFLLKQRLQGKNLK